MTEKLMVGDFEGITKFNSPTSYIILTHDFSINCSCTCTKYMAIPHLSLCMIAHLAIACLVYNPFLVALNCAGPQERLARLHVL